MARTALRIALGAVLALAVVAGLVGAVGPAGRVLAPAAAAAAAAGTGPVEPAPGHPWFGPALDIHRDTPQEYAERLGVTPSLYTFPVDYPLTTEGVDQLQRFARQMAAQGAVLVLQVEPTVDLDLLTETDARDLADLVAGLADRFDTRTLVRFAPEMNGSWRPWGQQPTSYVAAFRTVADAVHAGAPTASLVWSPVYGSGYPFRRGTGADSEIDLSGKRQLAPLDTDGNGRLDDGDDPYGPYYPGADAVDWVGLFLYRFGQSQGVDRNVVPPRDEVARRLADQWGYPRNPGRSFYDRFASATQPLLLETGALDNPSVGGASGFAVKRRWWREVFAALPTHPAIGAISWLELARAEPEVADEPVDWQVTRPERLAAAFRADLVASPVDLGPVTPVHPLPGAEPGAGTDGGPATPPADGLSAAVGGRHAGATAARVAGAVLLALLLLTLVGRRRRSWSAAGDLTGAASGRDRPLDVLRGLLLAGTVLLQLPVAGPLHDLAAGAVSVAGLETFLLVSGVATGLVYTPLAARLGQTAAAGRRFRRALVIWSTGVAGILAVYVLGQLPGVALRGVGALPERSGSAAAGADGDLYAGARHLFDYPPPGWVARDLLSYQLGTWVLAPLALLAVLVLLSPLAATPLHRGWWWVVLPSSWALYAVGRWQELHVLPSWSEQVAPLLVWQVLFVHGVALGRYRAVGLRLTEHLAGRLALAAGVVAAAVLLWLDRVPTGPGAELPLGRLLVVAAAAAVGLAVLTTCWRPLAGVLAPVLEPLGRVPLLVLLGHVLLLLVVADLGAPDAPLGGRLDTAVTGTVVDLVALTLLVLLATWRVRAGARSRARGTA